MSALGKFRGWMTPRFALVILAGVSGAVTLCVFTQPINSLPLRTLLLMAAGVFVIAVLALSWRNPPLRWCLLLLLGGALALPLLPGRSPDSARLEARYVTALSRYLDVPYVWGGEGRGGIDCSGLPRKAFRDALWEEGWRTFNGGLIREGLAQWWFDASARALASGYRGVTVPLKEKGTLRGTRFAALQPGDLAITESGVHCLAYLGNDRWIQADPAVGKVAVSEAAHTDNSWFEEPVALYRWTLLAP